MGVCHETSWFDSGIRGPACKKAASGSEGRRVVFQADNCFDEFYCSVISKDQGGAAATWRKKVLPVLRGALFRTIDNRTLVSSQHPGILLVSAHARRGDGKTRGASGAHLQSIIRGLGRAWNGRVNVTIHTDGHTKEVLEEIGTIDEDGRINVRALGSGDGVSLEAACLDIIRADVFLASDSTEDRGKGVKTERYDVAAGGFVDVTNDFWAGIVGRNTAVQIGQKGTWKLRVDWSSLSPVSALAREITSAMAHCDSSKGARTFKHLGGGVGMNLHTYHLPEANCEGADSWSDAAKTFLDHFETCPRYMNERRSVGDFMGAAMEYLFQSVRPEVIAEAERQAREAFPEGLPDPNNMVTVHMRWGDKPGEVGEKTPAEYFVTGVKRFVQMKGLGGSSPVHIYLASEDEVAIRAFGEKAPRNWRIHTSGPTGKGIQDVFLLTELIPPSVMFDVIYSTDVLEHTDCPLCELRTLHPKLKSNGVLIVHLRNDGADKSQGFGKYKKEQNHHIYTWNALLLANMLDSAGFIPCNVISEFSAWVHPIRVEHYERDKYAYCLLGLEHQGRRDEVNNLWAVAVKDAQSCEAYRRKLEDLLDCKY
ncbi:hypothetical protein THAOC_03994 [Thalassiosira oceanica]|uniref:Uncharacterized protein n=1 Tax=Thalassiosira oceanica TaxID=159749 RepID=K0T6C0_THAOC|nr:hypothetical protein THAOC_03994 [Thalassiosira oceanica]|eukprot:EJK74333.1 hypothetical protein THAOC_03994 [Thalassiosira oceanica]